MFEEILNKIKYFPQRIKYFIQRGKRGYSDEDVWGLNDYLAEVISSSIRHLGKTSEGCPEKLWDGSRKDDECHKWRETLEKIAEGFDAYLALDKLLFNKKGDEEYAIFLRDKFSRSMDLLKKYFDDLWD